MAPARRKPAPQPTPAKRRKKAAANEAASLDTATTEGTESMDLGDEGMDDPDEDLLNMPIPEPPQPCMSADGTGERLMITHVEMENFKSYFGRQTLGPFHKNFTAIIGPNGSGKSNVIDSLLFVFGYRASKIRSKKISVLIHSSAGHDHINSCTVWVHFQKVVDVDRTEYQVVEGSQFVVSRTAYRDNSSRYAYNGRTVQFKDLAVILRTSGIDLIHNRFLILQGEVEQISLMKPKAQTENDEGMLEYLEDIIGSSRLKAPIAKVERRLETLQQQRSGQLVRVKYAEKEKLDLEGPVKELIEQLRVDNAIAHVNYQIYSSQKLKTQDEIAALQPGVDELRDQRSECKDQLKEVLTTLAERKEACKELQKRFDDAQERHERVKTEFNEQKQTISKADADVKRLEEKRTKVEEEIGREEKKIAEYEKAPEVGSEKVRKLKVTLEQCERTIAENSAEMQPRLALVEEQTAGLCEKKKTTEVELQKLTAQEDKIGGELVLAQEELALLQNDEDVQRRKLAEIKDSLVDAERSVEAKTKELSSANERRPAVAAQLEDAQHKQRKLTQRQSELVDQQRDLRHQLGERQQLAEQSKSGNKMLNALMKEKAEGRIPGIFGRLGDLGGIDGKYDVAISTTCGPLDNIVVKNVETAQRCIDFLKAKSLGIATFIALDKQEHLRNFMDNAPKTPENAPRLFDLIRVNDDRVRLAFYYALRDTLVADTIEDATRISNGSKLQRFRVVSLKGEVVETSGMMTGGGNSQRRGRIGRNATVDTSQDSAIEDIGRMEATLRDIEEKLTGVRHDLNRANQAAAQYKDELQRLDRTIANSNAEIDTLNRKIDSLRKQVSEQKKRVSTATADEEKVRRAQEKVEQLKKKCDSISLETDKYRSEVFELTGKIDAIHEDLVGKYQSAVEKAEEEKARTQKAITKEQSATNGAERNLTKSLARMEDLKRDLEGTSTELERLKKEKKAAKERIKELAEQVEQRSEEAKTAEEELKAQSEADTELNNRELELNEKIQKLGQKIKEVETQIHRLQAKVEALQKEISKLKLHKVSHIICGGSDDPNRSALLLDETLHNTSSEALHNTSKGSQHNTETDVDVEPGEPQGEPQGEQQGEEPHEKPAAKAIDLTPNELDGGVMPELTEEAIRALDMEELRDRLEDLKEKKESQTREINHAILDDYVQRLRKYEAELMELTNISHNRDAHRDLCERLKKQRMGEFMDGFTHIGVALKEMYQMITLGGDASLDLVDSLDPFSEGVSFGVRPPKKSWKQITNLSGGEKTLASLALVFGLHHYRPTPLYVMDEIDAALDFRNVSIISNYVKERTKNAQFVIISLRNNMFERADRLVGIYKVNDCTHNVCVDPRKLEDQWQEDQFRERRVAALQDLDALTGPDVMAN